MNGKLFSQMLTCLCAALVLGLCLFGVILFLSNSFSSLIVDEILTAICDPQTQGLILLCACFYFIILMLLQPCPKAVSFWRLNASELWLIAAFAVATFSYVVDYPASTQSTQLLVLFVGASLGKGASVWAACKGKKWEAESGNKTEHHSGNDLVALVASLLVILLALASVWQTVSRNFEYHSHVRWTGPWGNPNVFGLLMGMGVVLACDWLVQNLRPKVQSRNDGIGEWKRRIGKYAIAVLCLVAAGLMSRGLLHSYSRGAWIATLCGFSYLVWHAVQCPKPKIQSLWRDSDISWFEKNWFPVCVILFSLAGLAFWQFRHSKHEAVASRIVSVGDVNDFSWRNRISAWEGALQIMAEYPALGAGWNRPETLYDHYYLPPKVEESAAIEMNDYLMLGATLGAPALICFGMYLWLSLTQRSEIRNQKSEIANRQAACPTLDMGYGIWDWPKTACRAGAIVLLIGFWFDGGLFTLSTAATFWILLELGSANMKN